MRDGDRNQTWSSWGEWLDYCEHTPAVASYHARHEGDSDPDTFGPWKFAGAMQRARNGYPEGLRAIREIADPIVNKVSQTIERFDPIYTDEATGALDIGRYLQGEPECWTQFVPVADKGTGRKYVTILFNGSALGHVYAHALDTKGAICAALIELLELAGMRVKVLLGYLTQYKTTGAFCRFMITLKDFDQPLDMDRLGFALGASAYRRISWRARANEHGPWDPNGTNTKDFPDAQDICDLYIPGGTLAAPSGDPIPWIIGKLKEQGVVLREDV